MQKKSIISGSYKAVSTQNAKRTDYRCVFTVTGTCERIRTATWWILSPLPLPIGLRRQIMREVDIKNVKKDYLSTERRNAMRKTYFHTRSYNEWWYLKQDSNLHSFGYEPNAFTI